MVRRTPKADLATARFKQNITGLLTSASILAESRPVDVKRGTRRNWYWEEPFRFPDKPELAAQRAIPR